MTRGCLLSLSVVISLVGASFRSPHLEVDYHGVRHILPILFFDCHILKTNELE